MTSKLFELARSVETLGERFINLAYLGKGQSAGLASNTLTQLCQSSWKYVVEKVVHVYKASHAGAATIARILFGWAASGAITEAQRMILLAGLLCSRMSPNRAALLAALIWRDLTKTDKAKLLKLCYSEAALRKLHTTYFDALAEFAEDITEAPPEGQTTKRQAQKVTFSTLAFAAADKAAGGSGKRTMTPADLARAAHVAQRPEVAKAYAALTPDQQAHAAKLATAHNCPITLDEIAEATKA